MHAASCSCAFSYFYLFCHPLLTLVWVINALCFRVISYYRGPQWSQWVRESRYCQRPRSPCWRAIISFMCILLFWIILHIKLPHIGEMRQFSLSCLSHRCLMVCAGAILGFFKGVAQGGPRSSQGGSMGKVIYPNTSGMTEKGHCTSAWTTNLSFLNKNHWTNNTCPQLLSLSKQTVFVCVSSELSHDLSAADRWLLVWSSLGILGN